MRLIILLLFISFTAFCSKFNVGDCICKRNSERWECEQVQYKVIEKGQFKYRCSKWYEYHGRYILDDDAYMQSFPYSRNNYYMKTKCNKEKK